ncbi:MAG: peptidoglycan-binding protein LysM [Bacteroidetes bacterium]|nr:peptidoglycan-binding protein LysM [Bacteroidota bacterium]
MGLFSFLKNAGSKIFTGKKAKKEVVTIPVEELNRQKASLLKGIVNSFEIPVEDLNIEVDGEKVVVFGQVESQADKEKIILALGNVEGIASVDDRMAVVKPEPEAVFYEVKKGDSLSKIAKAQYGDWRKYNDIFEANKPMLKDPDLIYPGQMLRIPPLDA